MELSLKKDSSNYGLSLAAAILPLYIHGGPLTDIFTIQQHIDQIKDYAEWSKLIEKWFISNQHKLILLMNPKSDHQESVAASEITKLKNDIESFTQDEISAIGR